jgi:hypothetical protein
VKHRIGLPDRIRPLAPFLAAVLFGALLTAIVVWALAPAPAKVVTIASGVAAVVLAVLQLLIMFRQTDLMARQDEILNRRAVLTVYGDAATEVESITAPLEGFFAQGGGSMTSWNIYVTNSGTRTAVGFNLSVRIDTGPFLYGESMPSGWTVQMPENQVVFVFESEHRIFPNDVYVLPTLSIAQAGSRRLPDMRDVWVRIAHEDGEPGWLLLAMFNALPVEFKEQLARPHERNLP